MAETLTPADVQRIATLARLELTPQEIALFAEQLTAILAYADQVQQVDTSGVSAETITSRSEPLRGTRADDLAPCLPRDTVLDQAPDADPGAGVFKVPRVLGS
jgi:aspartyl-tRNA(Asn)/glutamyl-tRNA(Gln) amidotransferase subunit C